MAKRQPKIAKSIEKELRQIRVAGMLARNMRNFEIAKKLGVARCTVTKDVQAIRAEYREVCAATYEEHLEREIAKSEIVERQLWKGWQRSCRDAVAIKTTISDGEDGKRTRETTIKGQSGNPAFLSHVLDCIALRCRMLGIEKAEKEQTVKERREVLEVVIRNREDLEQYRDWRTIRERLSADEAN